MNIQPASLLVIFGATGDLTHRKLIPALYNLAADGDLPAGLRVVGFARRTWAPDTVPALTSAGPSRANDPKSQS